MAFDYQGSMDATEVRSVETVERREAGHNCGSEDFDHSDSQDSLKSRAVCGKSGGAVDMESDKKSLMSLCDWIDR